MSRPPSATSSRSYGRPHDVLKLLKWQDVLNKAMTAPIPTAWRLDRTPKTKAITLKFELSAIVNSYVLNPTWQTVEGIFIPHDRFVAFFSKWRFVDIRDETGEYLSLQHRINPLVGSADNDPRVAMSGPISDRFQHEQRLLGLRLSIDNLESFSHVVYVISKGIITHPIPFCGQLDQRHHDLLATLPEGLIEWLEKTDGTGQIWTYLF